jgi:hypothetical protein
MRGENTVKILLSVCNLSEVKPLSRTDTKHLLNHGLHSYILSSAKKENMVYVEYHFTECSFYASLIRNVQTFLLGYSPLRRRDHCFFSKRGEGINIVRGHCDPYI